MKMKALGKCVALVCPLLLSVSALAAQPVQAKHAHVELISGGSGVVSGQQLWMALHFSLEKDWHIYWVNPGDSGQPPVLKWQLPRGFTAGEIQWPRPEKLQRSTMADYGYQDDVVFLVPVHVPAGLQDGGKVNISLQAKWLICREVCIPDHAELHMDLPVASGTGENQGQNAIIEEAKKRLPLPWPHGWRVSALSEKDDFVLSIIPGKPIQAVEFYPLAPEQIENAAAQPLEKTRMGAKLTLKKSDQLLKPISVLKGLLIMDGKAYQVAAPVTPKEMKAHNNSQ